MRVHSHRPMKLYVCAFESIHICGLSHRDNSLSVTTAVCGTVFILQLKLAPSGTFHLYHFQLYSDVGVGAQGCLAVSVSLTKHSGTLL